MKAKTKIHIITLANGVTNFVNEAQVIMISFEKLWFQANNDSYRSDRDLIALTCGFVDPIGYFSAHCVCFEIKFEMCQNPI